MIYVAGSMVLMIPGMVVSVVVAVAPIVLGVGGAYAIGKAIREGGK